MRRRRSSDSFNLAFLDVMSCGLGAAILLFLIVEHNVGQGAVEAEHLLSGLETLELKEQKLTDDMRRINRLGAEERRAAEDLRDKLLEIGKSLAALEKSIASQSRKNKAVEEAIRKIPPKPAEDIVEDRTRGEEEYLLGLKVEGRRVAILIDRSASMTDERLKAIITRKVRSDADKQKGPKWLRTKRVFRWLANRLPDDSQVVVIAFNDKARLLGKGWQKSDDKKTISGLFAEIDKLVPTGATDLSVALGKLAALRPPATNIYLVTDGLPTKGRTGSLKCLSNTTISGACRRLAFWNAIQRVLPSSRQRVNVVLLPLEGDAGAAALYWQWSRSTGGLAIVPATGWP